MPSAVRRSTLRDRRGRCQKQSFHDFRGLRATLCGDRLFFSDFDMHGSTLCGGRFGRGQQTEDLLRFVTLRSISGIVLGESLWPWSPAIFVTFAACEVVLGSCLVASATVLVVSRSRAGSAGNS